MVVHTINWTRLEMYHKPRMKILKGDDSKSKDSLVTVPFSLHFA
jgi:hypothetical protein